MPDANRSGEKPTRIEDGLKNIVVAVDAELRDLPDNLVQVGAILIDLLVICSLANACQIMTKRF